MKDETKESVYVNSFKHVFDLLDGGCLLCYIKSRNKVEHEQVRKCPNMFHAYSYIQWERDLQFNPSYAYKTCYACYLPLYKGIFHLDSPQADGYYCKYRHVVPLVVWCLWPDLGHPPPPSYFNSNGFVEGRATLTSWFVILVQKHLGAVLFHTD